MSFHLCKLGVRNVVVPYLCVNTKHKRVKLVSLKNNIMGLKKLYLFSALRPFDGSLIPFGKRNKAGWRFLRTMPLAMFIMLSGMKLLDSLPVVKARDVVWSSCHIADFPFD